MKINNPFSYFKRQEEKKGLYKINFPLLFLEWMTKFENKKLAPSHYYLYIPAFFIGGYILLLIGGKYIETACTFPVAITEFRQIEGIQPTILPGQDIVIPLKNGGQISGLWIDNKKEKTIFYFHGNGGSLGYFIDDITFLGNLGYNVIAYDYPGYGKSTGFPLESDVYDTTSIFYTTVKQLYHLDDKNIISVGYSIGSVMAIDFASKTSIDSLVLISPLASRYHLSQDKYGVALQKFFLLPDSMNSAEKIKSLTIPTLMIHGNEDTMVPISQGKILLRNSVSQKKYFVELDGQGHNGLLQSNMPILKKLMSDFLLYKELEKSYYFISYTGSDLTKIHPTTQTTLLQESIPSIGNTGKTQSGNTLYGTGLQEMKTDDIADYSLVKYVSPFIGFSDIGYIPNNLVHLSSDYLFDQKGTTYLRKDAADALNLMARDFYNTFGTKIGVASGYRSYAYQKGIKDKGCSDALCAHPGHSEHQTGLAVDVFEASTEDSFMKKTNLKNYYWWMKKNAHLYGFHNTYQKGILIDGYMKEPWHWRYLGVDLATLLHDKNITFAEYYNEKK